jgi:hypothetical protein
MVTMLQRSTHAVVKIGGNVSRLLRTSPKSVLPTASRFTPCVSKPCKQWSPRPLRGAFS